MNDREYRTWATKIGKRTDYWRHHLALGHWRIDWSCKREPWANDDGTHATCWAEIQSQPEYLSADIRFNVAQIHADELSDRRLDNVIIHELMHCHLSELRALVGNDKWDHHVHYHEEHVVSMLANVVQFVIDEGQRLGKAEAKKGAR